MTTVIVSEDCGNSPKNIFLQNLTIAFAKGDTEYVLNSVTDDIRWNIVGEKLFQGREDFIDSLEMMGNEKVKELTIFHVVSHGKAGAVNGIKKLKNGKTFAFCKVYEFSGAKGTSVREITSYLVELSQR